MEKTIALIRGDGIGPEIVGQAVWESYCSRCLEPFEREVRLESRFLGSKDPDLVARGSHTLGSQDLDVVFFPEPMLDEEALVREQFQLQVPMPPVALTRPPRRSCPAPPATASSRNAKRMPRPAPKRAARPSQATRSWPVRPATASCRSASAIA